METVLQVMFVALFYVLGMFMGYGLHQARAYKQLAHFFHALAEHIEKTDTMPSGEQVATYVQFWIKP